MGAEGHKEQDMKTLKWLLVLSAIMVLLAGCTSNSRYKAAVDKNTSIEQQVTDLTSQLRTLQGKYDQVTKVYPPHGFTTLKDLTAWLVKDTTSNLPPAKRLDLLRW